MASRSVVARHLGLIGFGLVLGCDSSPSEQPTDLSRSQSALSTLDVTPSGSFAAQGQQSETSINVTPTSTTYPNGVIAVAYNDFTPQSTLTFTSTDRIICKGTSLMGWSSSTNWGSTWNRGRLSPSLFTANGETVTLLWGDPTLARQPSSTGNDANVVWFTALATPNSAFTPTSGPNCRINQPGATPSVCVARSPNGGTSFSAYGCVSLTTPQIAAAEDYDGPKVAVAENGDVYIAVKHIGTIAHDVYRKPALSSTFSLLPNPFPGTTVQNHPSIKVYNSVLYIAARSLSGTIVLNKYSGGSWGSSVNAPTSVPAYLGGVPMPSPLKQLRSPGAPPFAFEVGPPTAAGNDHLRLIYVYKDTVQDRIHLKGFYCDLNLNCSAPPDWTTDSDSSDEFIPSMYIYPGTSGTVKFAYLSRNIRGLPTYTNTLAMRYGLITGASDGTRSFSTYFLADVGTPCVTNAGYWGDYNETKHLRWVTMGSRTYSQSLSTYTSSRGVTDPSGCSIQGYSSNPHFVSGLVYE